MIAIHSSTPRLDGRDRPWHASIEFWQDLIDTPDGGSSWCHRLAVSMRHALEQSRRKTP